MIDVTRIKYFAKWSVAKAFIDVKDPLVGDGRTSLTSEMVDDVRMGDEVKCLLFCGVRKKSLA